MTRQEKEKLIQRGLKRMKRLGSYSEVILGWNEPERVIAHKLRICALGVEIQTLNQQKTDEELDAYVSLCKKMGTNRPKTTSSLKNP